MKEEELFTSVISGQARSKVDDDNLIELLQNYKADNLVQALLNYDIDVKNLTEAVLKNNLRKSAIFLLKNYFPHHSASAFDINLSAIKSEEVALHLLKNVSELELEHELDTLLNYFLSKGFIKLIIYLLTHHYTKTKRILFETDLQSNLPIMSAVIINERDDALRLWSLMEKLETQLS